MPIYVRPCPGIRIWRIVRVSIGPPLRTTPTCPMSSRATLTPETPTISARPVKARRKVASRRRLRRRITLSAQGGGPLRPLAGAVTGPCSDGGADRLGACTRRPRGNHGVRAFFKRDSAIQRTQRESRGGCNTSSRSSDTGRQAELTAPDRQDRSEPCRSLLPRGRAACSLRLLHPETPAPPQFRRSG